MSDTLAISIRVPGDLGQWLKSQAKAEDRSLNKEIIRVLKAAQERAAKRKETKQ